MNERQVHELQELSTLEAAGTLEEAQKLRLEELKAFKTMIDDGEKTKKDFASAEAQKKHFREKFEASEIARIAAESKANATQPKGGNGEGNALGIQDFIDISTSLEGLDQKEKAYVAREHKMSGKPISEIRKDDDFLLWQKAYREKLEKEKQTIIPNSKQPDDDSPISLEDALKGKTLEEQAKLLEEHAGYSIGKKSITERVRLG